MSLKVTQVDAFTDEPFAGNPAGVCLLPEARDETWMQRVAREMNLSETAFLVKREDGSFDLRWFTPVHEVDLCGHATLASAHVFWEDGTLVPDEQARFHSKSGLLTCERRDGWIEMDFPATPVEPADAPDGLIEGLGAPPAFVGSSKFDYIVELESERAVREIVLDTAALRRVRARGIAVTARASSNGFDYVARFFAPAWGIEDPVTGSIQSALAPYWGEKLGKDEMLCYQASARGGVLRVKPRGERVLIAGKAVTTLRGELLY